MSEPKQRGPNPVKIGDRFEYMEVKEIFHDQSRGRTHTKCRMLCHGCGGEKEAWLSDVKKGSHKSCGCKQNELMSKYSAMKTHGLRDHAIYSDHQHMMARCYGNNPKDKCYKDRNIQVCEDWKDITLFLEWAINNGWKEGLSLERKNNYKNYEPENCEWILKDDISKNKTSHRMAEAWGESKNLTDWSKDPRCSITYIALKARFNSDTWLSNEERISTPSKAKSDTINQNFNPNTSNLIFLEAFGERKHLAEWARDPRCTISYNCLYRRYTSSKYTDLEAITSPYKQRRSHES